MAESPSSSKKKWTSKKIREAVLAFSGPLLILSTYVVKEHLRDGVRDKITTIETEQQTFLVRKSQYEVLTTLGFIQNTVDNTHAIVLKNGEKKDHTFSDIVSKLDLYQMNKLLQLESQQLIDSDKRAASIMEQSQVYKELEALQSELHSTDGSMHLSKETGNDY